MIRITRGPPPTGLTRAAPKAHAALRRAYDRNRRAYARGERKFDFDRDLYGSAKTALEEAQHGKCAFCEAKILHVSPGDVEHFRPKAARRRAAGAPLERPGYYWLAYEWANLLLSCASCNRRGKGNLFPLRDETRRARDHHGKVAVEEPMFVDPGSEDPTEHVGFRQEVAFGRTDRGEATRNALDLNRAPLLERRREHLAVIRSLREAQSAMAAVGAPGLLDAIGLQLDRMTRDEAEYAAMVRAALGLGLT